MKKLAILILTLAMAASLAVGQCIVPAQTASVKMTSYAALAGDAGKMIVMNCASNCTLTLPSSPQSPNWTIWVSSIGAGIVTVSPNGLQLNGSTNSITIQPGVGEGLMISTDNSNYFSTSLNPASYAAGGGTAQAQTITLNPPVAALVTGLFVAWKPIAANTATAPTLAVNGLTATAITKNGTAALVANDLTTTAIAYAIYDGTEFQLLNPQTKGVTRTIGYSFGDAVTGSALTTSEVGYVTVPFACTITGWHLMSTTAETVTVKTYRVNGGTALPTSGNSISTSGVSLSSGTKVDSSTVTDFTSTAIAANDTLAFAITAVTASKQVTFQLDCYQ